MLYICEDVWKACGSSKKFKLELSMGNPAEFSKYSYRKGDNAEPEEVL